MGGRAGGGGDVVGFHPRRGVALNFFTHGKV